MGRLSGLFAGFYYFYTIIPTMRENRDHNGSTQAPGIKTIGDGKGAFAADRNVRAIHEHIGRSYTDFAVKQALSIYYASM